MNKLEKMNQEKHEKVLLILKFIKENGREPKLGEEYDEVKIGNFLYNIKKGDTRICDDDRELLKNIGVNLYLRNVKKEVHDKVELLLEFVKEMKREPKTSEEYKNVKIGSFLMGIRYGKTQLSDSDRQLLKDKGILF